MKRYQTYKDSGVEWIGEIPEHWKILPIRALCHLGRGRVISNEEIARNPGEYPVYSSQTANNGEMGRINSYDFDGEYVTWTTDGANAGTVFYRYGKFNCTNVCGTLKSKNKLRMPLLPYILNLGTRYYVRYDINPKLMNNMIAKIKISVPPYLEQTDIAAYLDRQTTQIDNLISKKQKLIELLKEERSAIINQAVTKGLNPDAPMKDSGIEWIGEIPAHWEVKRLKYIARITLGKMLTNVDKGGYHYRPYLRAQNINWEKVNVEDVKKMWFSKDELHQYRLNKNDLLVSEGGEVGRTSMWDEEIEECYIQNSVHKVTMKFTNDPFFFLYTFCLFGQKGVFESVASRISIAHLTKEKLKETVFPVPPNDEQERISEFISAATTKIDQTTSKIEKQVELLKEYRTALISEVVTGKIDVRT